MTDLFEVIEATWPAANYRSLGPWTIREGQGGGQRVSAASATGPIEDADIARAENAMEQLGQKPIFMLRGAHDPADPVLDLHGYRVHDPVAIYAVDIGLLTGEPLPPVSAFSIWPPLAIQRDIWESGGIGADRIAVMDRVTLRKTAILGRQSDQPAGSGFVAIHENTAMVHAIEVAKKLRRQGVGGNILRAAAIWAQNQGAQDIALLVTRANHGANALYKRLGMNVVGSYHYRIK